MGILESEGRRIRRSAWQIWTTVDLVKMSVDGLCCHSDSVSPVYSCHPVCNLGHLWHEVNRSLNPTEVQRVSGSDAVALTLGRHPVCVTSIHRAWWESALTKASAISHHQVGQHMEDLFRQPHLPHSASSRLFPVLNNYSTSSCRIQFWVKDQKCYFWRDWQKFIFRLPGVLVQRSGPAGVSPEMPDSHWGHPGCRVDWG